MQPACTMRDMSDPSPHRHHGIDYVELTVTDLERAKRFYAEAFGWQFNDYGPAYGFGVDARSRHPGRDFDDVEADMSRDWAASRGASSLDWDRARLAARDAWNRIGSSS